MGDSLTFQFKDHSEEAIYYVASYSGGDNLTLEKHKHERPERDPRPVRGPRIPKYKKLGPVSDPWPVFCTNATFDDILWALLGERKRYDKDEADDLFYTYKFFTVKKKDGTEIGTCTFDDKTFLKGIGDNPDILRFHPEFLDRFVRILWIAKTGVAHPYIKKARRESQVLKTRKKYKKMFIDNLMPSHKGGARKDLPQHMRLAEALLKKLADHLSKECINFFKEQGHWTGRRESLTGDEWQDNHSRLIEWGKVHEYRICKLDPEEPEELHTLIEKPKHYAEQLLERTFDISPRTRSKL